MEVAMTLEETGLAEGFEKVCFGDAFVYGFPSATSGCDSNFGGVWLSLASFLLTFKRAGHEC
jgi:hypothetical protein